VRVVARAVTAALHTSVRRRVPIACPCISTHVKIPCGSCNRTFRSQPYFVKHKTNKLKGKPVYMQKRNCAKCNSLILRRHKHECFKQYCSFYQQNREAGHYSYMRPLANELPRSDNVLFVFYYFETTQDTKLTESASVHIPNLVCLQHFCVDCEKDPDIDADCVRCGRRNTRSGMPQWATCLLIFVRNDRGVRK